MEFFTVNFTHPEKLFNMIFVDSFHQTSHIKDTGQTEAIFVIWIFQVLAAIIIIGVAFLYGMFVEHLFANFDQCFC
jgi:hypothetical protein